MRTDRLQGGDRVSVNDQTFAADEFRVGTQNDHQHIEASGDTGLEAGR